MEQEGYIPVVLNMPQIPMQPVVVNSQTRDRQISAKLSWYWKD